ncbi:hypothetical protein HPB50_005821 [Hyalomma asiaticum]|uniref:Uncharacterized protein n=1 Tax=Hyalomma asiaticum TaxID=266040 RepID=A0ACB7SKN8_HYAAI|nr:hypothetical protein HPB50_005821 [Hyalomma asiaticum]
MYRITPPPFCLAENSECAPFLALGLWTHHSNASPGHVKAGPYARDLTAARTQHVIVDALTLQAFPDAPRRFADLTFLLAHYTHEHARARNANAESRRKMRCGERVPKLWTRDSRSTPVNIATGSE